MGVFGSVGVSIGVIFVAVMVVLRWEVCVSRERGEEESKMAVWVESRPRLGHVSAET